jgi:hypothetical protein
MLPRPTAKYQFHPTILLLSTKEDLALPTTPPKRKKSKGKRQQPDEPPSPPRTPEQTQGDSKMSTTGSEYDKIQ